MTRIPSRRPGAGRGLATLAALALGALALFSAPDASAALAPGVSLGPEETSLLGRIDGELESIRTLQAGFLQSSSNGQSAQGRIWLSRPGRMRIEYQPPVPVLVVADGRFLVYYDSSLEQVSYVPLGSTPASILLEKHLGLMDASVLITEFQKVGPTVEVTVARADHPGEGVITLIFDEATLSLVQWRIEDAQGITTLVTLVDPRFNVSLDRDLFVFRDPRPEEGHSP